ncbi:MAG: HAMP domain-containing sensor histidine kinase [Ginsengibacter sp.]
MNEDFFKIISKFGHVDTRLDAAGELASLVRAEEILCFLFDPAQNTFIPVPGFSQTPVDSQEWQQLLQYVWKKPIFSTKIILPGKNESDVVTIGSGDGCVLVLVNYEDHDGILKQLQTIFVLIAALIKTEASNLELQNKMKTMMQSSPGSAQLSLDLDDVKAKLRQSLKTEGEFLSVASHELKTPITSISAYIQVLLNIYTEDSSEIQTHYILKRTKFQVNRLIRLMGDLLDATKIKKGKLDLNMDEIFLDDVVDKLIIDYSSSLLSHKITRKGGGNGKVICDRSRIEQVICNLLDNAIKYSPGADTIIINTGSNNDNVLCSVQDFGIGIQAENKNKIFDRFFRAHGEDSGGLSSLGLGLYISADIIQQHHGKIWLESEPGKGSTFHFSLPIHL